MNHEEATVQAERMLRNKRENIYIIEREDDTFDVFSESEITNMGAEILSKEFPTDKRSEL